MYIFKNALISIWRNKGRNILIGVIILVITIASTVSLSILNASNKLISSYEEKNEIIGSITMNRESLMQNFDPNDREQGKENLKEQFSNIEEITVDNIKNYADSNYVKSYYYIESLGLNSSNIEKATSESINDRKGPMMENQESQAAFTLTGYSSIESMKEFIEGSYKITEGEISTDFTSNNCIINKELATLNDLSVGDKIVLVNPNNTLLTYEFTITGIFEDNSDVNAPSMDMFSNSVNNIITNTTALEKIYNDDTTLRNQITPTFILKNKAAISKFEKELQDKGLSEYLTLTTNLNQVESSIESISNVKTFAITFLVITLIIGSIVLFVINMINIRERKYEIGVLRTIGMKKSLVATKFVIELLIVSLASLILGTISGSLISVPTANKLLENEINSSKQNIDEINKNFGGNMMDKPDIPKDFNIEDNNFKKGTIQKIDKINAVVDIKVILELLIIGIVLTLISSLAAVITIQRFSPLTILKERG